MAAVDVVETLALRRDAFEEVRERYPSVERVLVRALADEVRRLSGLLVEALYVPADKRVYLRLLDLVRLFGGPAPAVPIVIPLTQEQIGEMAGTTRPTANRILRGAEDAGLLTITRGRIEILDVDALARRAH